MEKGEIRGKVEKNLAKEKEKWGKGQRAAASRDKKKGRERGKNVEVRRMELYYCKNMYENKRIKIKLWRMVRYKITE